MNRSARDSVVVATYFAVTLFGAGTCSRHTMTFEYERVAGHTFSRAERGVIEDIAEKTAEDVRRLLPALPVQLRLRVRTGTDVVEETGETASAFPPDYVSWTVDPRRTGGVEATARRQLRGTLFYEFHLLVRSQTVQGTSLLDRAIAEGMATAFARDASGSPTPWGAYPANVSQWVTEFMALPSDATPDFSMSVKVGTYLVDRARVASGRTPADLVSTSASDVVALALAQ